MREQGNWGGQHLHGLCGFPVNQASSVTPSTMIPMVLSHLIRNSLSMAYLQMLDVLFIEEIGLVPSHILYVADYVLRAIRKCQKPFGGILVIAS